MPALLAVVAAFMAGMAIGAWWISKRVTRSPAKWYGSLEIAIGLWACVTAGLIPVANGVALRWIGVQPSVAWHWFVAFAVPFFVLLPATAAMGATLPVMERFITPLSRAGRSVGALYAANTLGAVSGVLWSTFSILPRLGLRRTLFIFAAVNLAGGVIALLFGDRRQDMDLLRKNVIAPRRLWVTLFATGLLGIGYEVVGVRVLAQVLEGTIYTYAATLSVFLLGSSLGAALYHRIGQRWQLADLLGVTALACTAGIVFTTRADDLYGVCRDRFGATIAGTLLAEMVVAGASFLLPTLAMGATFSHLAQWATSARGGLGRALAVNTLGAALAPLMFSVVLLPSIGRKWAWALIAVGYLFLLPSVRGWRLLPVFLVPALLLAFPVHLRFVTVPQGGRLLGFLDGVMASVAIVSDHAEHRSLRVDNRFQMGGTGVADAEYRHAHIPLLLHPSPRRALFLGLGTGITLGAAAWHGDVTADGVELLPEVVELMPQFSPYNDAVRTNERVRVCVADARRFAQRSTNRYDVIVGDLFHPARDGAGSLYTIEHFTSIRERLAPGGLFCQWLPLHQLDLEMLRVVTRTFLTAFPDTQAWLLRFNVDAPVVGLVGRTSPIAYSTNWLEARGESPLLTERLQGLSLGDSLRLLGNVLAGPLELDAFARGAQINTDDNSVVLFGAPEFTYRNDAASYTALTALLELQVANTAVLGFDSPALSAFIEARNVFLRGLIDEAEGRIDAAFARYVESARTSADFTAGYARVITAAAADANADPARSRKLLEQLVEAQPAQPVAKRLLERLFP
jgi:spermidine synthase